MMQAGSRPWLICGRCESTNGSRYLMTWKPMNVSLPIYQLGETNFSESTDRRPLIPFDFAIRALFKIDPLHQVFTADALHQGCPSDGGVCLTIVAFARS